MATKTKVRGNRTLVYGESLVMGHCMALGVYPFWSLRKVNIR
jgi:hypothetical protein